MKKNIVLIVSLVLIDQLIKVLVFEYLSQANSITLISGVLSLTYVENTGAAFGLWNSRWLLVALNIIIIFVIVKLLLSKKYEFTKPMKIAYSLILSGGITNLIDRLIRGYVIDYIDITELFNYPVFNLADICIIIGVVIIVITIITKTLQKQEQNYERVQNKQNK